MNRNTTDEETITRQKKKKKKKTRHFRSGTKKTDCGDMSTFAKDRGRT